MKGTKDFSGEQRRLPLQGQTGRHRNQFNPSPVHYHIRSRSQGHSPYVIAIEANQSLKGLQHIFLTPKHGFWKNSKALPSSNARSLNLGIYPNSPSVLRTFCTNAPDSDIAIFFLEKIIG